MEGLFGCSHSLLGEHGLLVGHLQVEPELIHVDMDLIHARIL